MSLKQHIQQGYTDVALLNKKLGAVRQRDYICKPIYNPIKKDYPDFDGYVEASDYGLSCGFPFKFADIQNGDTVIDLGCATGIDSFIASKQVGKNGRVFGYDLTEVLIERANSIAETLDIQNISFEIQDIKELPHESESVDVAISNGVFSLIPDLDKVFSEIYRVLKSDGVFCMADINKTTKFSEASYTKLKEFTGCLNGIRTQDLYLEKFKTVGFEVEIVHERVLDLPDDLVLDDEQNGLRISTFRMRK